MKEKKETPSDAALILQKLADKEWRMSNLYYVVDKNANKVLFQPNETQKLLLKYMKRHPRNVILKSRQLGVSTWAVINMLDDCLFNENYCAYVVAQTMDDAKKLLATKAKFPYDNLPKWLKEQLPLKTDSTEVLRWHNGSELLVDTSVRSATASALHVSELGKLSKIAPDKAREVKSGGFNAVAANRPVTVESTAEGVSGEFYDICKEAMRMKAAGEELTALDFQFIFFPWFFDRTNELTPEDTLKVRIPAKFEAYFEEIKRDWLKLDPEVVEDYFPLREEQKAWYYKKHKEQGADLMFQEQPSTPDEAFNQSIEGAYYEDQFTKIDEENRITQVPYERGMAVYTAWDLGMSDDMAIIFYCRFGREVRIINSYSNSGESLSHYAEVLNKYRMEFGYNYAAHFAPHDINVRELTTGKSRLETARSHGINFTMVPQIGVMDGIGAVRQLLSVCWFDKDNCATDNPNKKAKGSGKYSLVSCLRLYRKEWDERRGCYKEKPLHDFTSHFADAMRYLAISIDYDRSVGRRRAFEVKKRNWMI